MMSLRKQRYLFGKRILILFQNQSPKFNAVKIPIVPKYKVQHPYKNIFFSILNQDITVKRPKDISALHGLFRCLISELITKKKDI